MLYAGILHALIGASLLYAFDWSRPVLPEVPLVIKGTVVAEMPPAPLPEPEPERAPPPEPEPEPEPEPLPEPDDDEQLRIEAEERQRQEDLARERERIAREEEAERQRQQEADAERRRREEAERKRREEAELERQRQEAERRRLEEIERQRQENERRRREAEEAERRAQLERELAAEQERLDAMNAGALARYTFALRQKIERNWVRPPSATAGTRCEVSVRQLPGGEVVNVVVERCNGDEAVRRSVEAAVYKASPLPEPEDPSLFERNLRFVFEPTQ
jgi:colicin import membrane protein